MTRGRLTRPCNWKNSWCTVPFSWGISSHKGVRSISHKWTEPPFGCFYLTIIGWVPLCSLDLPKLDILSRNWWLIWNVHYQPLNNKNTRNKGSILWNFYYVFRNFNRKTKGNQQTVHNALLLHLLSKKCEYSQWRIQDFPEVVALTPKLVLQVGHG